MNAVYSYPNLYEHFYCLTDYLQSRWTGLAGILYACSDHVVTNGVYITLTDIFLFLYPVYGKNIKEDWLVEQNALLLDPLGLNLP